MTVAQFVERWLVAVSPTVRRTTAASYADVLRGHVVSRLGDVRLSKVTPFVLAQLYSDLSTSGRRVGSGGLAPRTVRYVHRVLSHALSDAVRWGLLPRNPATAVSPPRASNREMATWSPHDVRRFFAGVAGDRTYTLWVVLAMTGMRRGEVLGLRWRDVDLERRRLNVVQTLVEVDYEVIVSEPKTGSGRRVVVVAPFTARVLALHRDSQRAERLDLGLDNDAELVFTKADGRPLQPQNVSQAFENLVRRHALPRIRLHDLRHTAATLALIAGVPTKVVSERLGHANVQITLDLYTHVTDALQEDTATKVAALIIGDDADASTDALSDSTSQASSSS
jgi:integrase